MATPAAVLSILVKTQGAQAAAAQLGGIDKSGRAAAGGISKAEGQAKRSSKTFSAMGTAAKSAGVLIGAAGLAKGISSAVTEYREAQKVGGQTTAVLKSTGSAANVSAKHINNLAASISKKSGIDDEAIQSSENMLLTFTKVRNETGKGNKIFDQATQTVTDMSAALGQSGKSSAIQLGKALNDPIKGITALRRVGVSFTADQQKQITTLEKTGHHLDAQKIILKELRTEFAGSAAAQATAGDKFKMSLGNLAEAAGAVLVPAMDKVLPVLTRFFDQMVTGTGVGGALISKFKEFGGALAPLGQSIATIVGWLQQHEGVSKVLAIGLGILTGAIIALNIALSLNPFVAAGIAIAALVVGVVAAYQQFQTFRNVVDTVVGAVKSALPTIVAVAQATMTAFLAVFRAVWPVIKGYFQGGFIAIKGIISGAAQILSGAVQVIKGVLHGDFREIWDGIKTIFRGAFTGIKGIITGAAHALGAAASAVGNAISGAFSGALGSAARVVVGFVNGIIDVINKIPGVNIGHVGVPQSLQAASKAVGNTAQGQTHGFARGGAFGLTGGVVNAPMVMMGEEAPTHPEFVIPTNPAYRKRARGLLAQAAGTIGGMAKGGVLGAIGGAIAGGAKGLLGKLPGVGDLPSWMKGMGSFVLGKVGSFIKDKVTDILPGGGGGGGSQATSTSGLVPRVLAAVAFARAHGWKGQINSGFRSDAEQVRIWNSGIRPAAKPKSLGGPGSNHSLGQAVDVSDIPGFQRAMNMMPADKRLYSRVANDPVHFSVTGHRKGGIVRAFAKGGVNGGVENEQQWLNDSWTKVAPLFGQSAANTPLPSLFKHIRFSGATPFVGVATTPGKGNSTAELLWPRWLWQSSKDQKKLDNRTKLQLFIHEMAHRFQSAKETGAEWLSEGGAEAFARISMSRQFGGAIRSGSDPYNAFVTKVMKEKGVGWVTSGQFANASAGAGQPGHGQSRSGVNVAIAAARRAGFKGADLVNMIAIAGRESGYNPGAQNLVPPDHSIGLWQINQLAHHGRFGTDAQLKDPYTNAKAAFALSGGGHNLSPWQHAGGPLGGTNVAAARAAVEAFKGGTSTGGGGNSAAGGGGGGGGAAPAATKVNPFDQKIANADLAIQQAQRGTVKVGAGLGARKVSSSLQQIQAKLGKRQLIGKRIKSIRKALKGKLSPAKRLALTQELTQRLQEHSQLGTEIQALKTPAAVGGDGGSFGDGGDPNQPLIDAINAAAEQAAEDARIRAEADKAHTDALNAVRDEVKRQTDFAANVQSTSNFQLTKSLADMLSGQIVGFGVAGRSFTPGRGVEATY